MSHTERLGNRWANGSIARNGRKFRVSAEAEVMTGNRSNRPRLSP